MRKYSIAILIVGSAALTGCFGSGGTTTVTQTVRPKRQTRRVFYVQQTGLLQNAVQWPATTAADGSLIAAGGLDQADQSVSAITSVTEGGSKQLGTLPSAFHDAAAATVNGTVYVFGGGDAGSSRNQILSVSPTGATVRVGTLPVGISDIEAATIGSTAYIVGGYDGAKPVSSIDAFVPGKPVKVVGQLPQALRYASVTAAGGKVIVAGGTDGTTSTDRIYSFDPAGGKVRLIGHLPTPNSHAAAASIGGKAYVIGGRSGDPGTQLSGVVEIDPVSGRTRTVAHLPSGISDMGAAAVSADAMLAIGGKDKAGTVHRANLKLGWRTETVGPANASAASAPAADAIPPLLDAANVYAAEAPGHMSANTAGAKALVYVPNSESNTLDVIDQHTMKVIAHYPVGRLPQHVTPAWDLKRLYITNDYGNSLTVIDPKTGKPGRVIPVDDPYNLYFTADGKRAIVVAEALRRLDFRDAQTFAMRKSLAVPDCHGVDHMDYTADGRKALVSCEFDGRMIVVDLIHEKQIGSIDLRSGAQPQDVKISPDGKVFYVADMMSNGVWLIDAKRIKKIDFVRTGMGAHGLYPSRDAKRLFVSNRGEGSITVISFASRKPIAQWKIPGGGSPDMGGLSADGKVLWLSGRYNGDVYAISTASGKLIARLQVGSGPHGLAVWPQPGRYSIGHTGILR